MPSRSRESSRSSPWETVLVVASFLLSMSIVASVFSHVHMAYQVYAHRKIVKGYDFRLGWPVSEVLLQDATASVTTDAGGQVTPTSPSTTSGPGPSTGVIECFCTPAGCRCKIFGVDLSFLPEEFCKGACVATLCIFIGVVLIGLLKVICESRFVRQRVSFSRCKRCRGFLCLGSLLCFVENVFRLVLQVICKIQTILVAVVVLLCIITGVIIVSSQSSQGGKSASGASTQTSGGH